MNPNEESCARIVCYLTPAEKTRIKNVAHDRGTTVTEIMRQLIRDHLTPTQDNT